MLFNSSADLLEIACREGTIKFGDQALLWALASRVKPSTGKIEYRISVLAKRMGITLRPPFTLLSSGFALPTLSGSGRHQADMSSG